MAARRPLVVVGGITQELPAGDTVTPLLISTATKTASYTAAPGEQVLLDTTSATPIVVTLPTIPPNGSVVEVGWILGANATATTTPSGSGTFAGGGTTSSLLYLYQFRRYHYRTTGDLWTVENSMPISALDARYRGFAKRVTTIVSSATPTFNTDTCDIVDITALAAAVTSMSSGVTGTPTKGQLLEIDIADNGTARALSWGSMYYSATTAFALPTTTVAGKPMRAGFTWSTVQSKFGLVALAQEP